MILGSRIGPWNSFLENPKPPRDWAFPEPRTSVGRNMNVVCYHGRCDECGYQYRTPSKVTPRNEMCAVCAGHAYSPCASGEPVHAPMPTSSSSVEPLKSPSFDLSGIPPHNPMLTPPLFTPTQQQISVPAILLAEMLRAVGGSIVMTQAEMETLLNGQPPKILLQRVAGADGDRIELYLAEEPE